MPRTHSFYEGFSAFESGKQPNKNHYPPDSKEFKLWNEGYRAAHDDFINDDLIEESDYEKTINLFPEFSRQFSQ